MDGSSVARRKRAPYNEKWNFDSKLAKEAMFHDDGKNTAAWLKKVSNYLVGQCPHAELLFKWADHQHSFLAARGGMASDADPVQVSQRIWSWLQIPFIDTGTIELDVNSTKTPNGLEVWRKLSVPAARRSIARRFALRDRVQQPKQCSTFAGVLDQLVEWNKFPAEYALAGAAMPPEQDRRHAQVKMLPGSSSPEMHAKANSNSNFDDLVEWVRAQDELIQDYASKSLHVAEQESTSGRIAEDQGRDGDIDEQEEELEELHHETLAVMSVAAVSAFYKARAAKICWNRQRGQNFKLGAPGARAARVPRAQSAPAQMKCNNCGNPKGHRAAGLPRLKQASVPALSAAALVTLRVPALPQHPSRRMHLNATARRPQ